MFADLHCHPSNRSFNSLRSSDRDPWLHSSGSPLAIDQTIWYQNPDDLKEKRKELERGFKGDMATFPQCDLRSLTDSDTRIVFAALYPIEKGFVMGNEATGISAKSFTALTTRLLTKGRKKWLIPIIKPITWALNPLLNLLINNPGPVRDLLQKTMMRFTKSRINFFQSPEYDYFQEIQYEFEFYQQANGQNPPIGAYANRFQLIETGEHLRQVVEHSTDIAVILTIEGMHALAQEADKPNNQLRYVGWPELERRIRLVKTWNIFFITFAHHYKNELAGHARSLPELMQQITDQVPMRHHPVTPDGKKAIRLLLSITEDNKPDSTSGRRVLIDLKHMAAKGRLEFYQLIRAYNQQNPSDQIPAIASHVGYANRKTLAELIQNADHERDNSFVDRFYQWNINICDEEIRWIVESGGIIGLSFDQRIVGVDLDQRPGAPENWAWYLTNNILAFARACFSSSMSSPQRVWDCIGLGTDFDGFVDPVNHFGTAERFGFFMTTFIAQLSELDQPTRQYLGVDSNPFTPEQVAEKIGWRNAYEFAHRNFKP